MTTALYMRNGRFSSNAGLGACIDNLEPEISWFEPIVHLPSDEKPGPVHSLATIAMGPPHLRELPVEELRLSWFNGLLHIVAAEDGYRWAIFETQPGAVMAELGESPPRAIFDLAEEVRPALWRTDMTRFLGRNGGGETVAPVDLRLNVRAFRRSAEILTWWLVPRAKI